MADTPRAHLNATLVRGVAWVGAFRWSAQILGWASTLLVVRLLTPRDYGIAGIAMMYVGLAGLVSEFGMGAAIVALPERERGELARLHGFAIAVAATLAALTVGLALPLSRFFREPALARVLALLGLALLSEGMRVVPTAILSKDLQYRATGFIDFLKASVTSALVLLLAALKFGYWALILGNLGGSLVATVFTLLRYPLPVRWPRLDGLQEVVRYSWHILVGRASWYAYRNADFAVAGRMLGSGILGHYTIAWNIASLPGEKLTTVITAATTPFFARIQGDRDSLRFYFLRITEVLSLVIVPLLAGLILVADLAVPVVLGPAWIPAVPALRLLVGYAVLQSVSTPISQVLTVCGRARLLMWNGLLCLAVLPPAFVLGASLAGGTGIAAAWLITYPILALPAILGIFRTLDLRLFEYAAAWGSALRGAAAMTAAVVGLRYLLPHGFPPAIELAAAVLTGGAAYAGTVHLLDRGRVRRAIEMIRAARATGAPVAEPAAGAPV
ncbi:MAG TPA: oligosaccharide flippase family protein [Gemmatimonadales bacterium]